VTPEFGPHTLVRIASADILHSLAPLEPWVPEALRSAPWVVIRRAPASDGRIPVGVRGAHRAQRFAAWVEAGAVIETLTPRLLASRRPWARSARRGTIPALRALDTVESIASQAGFAAAWGPTGSVGFELASGQPTVRATSDLDLALWADRPLPVAAARALVDALESLPARADVLIETPHGAVALAEYARSAGMVALRTAHGPRLVSDCWEAALTAAG
jgi:phosphoribosyl-dephospho-CoA transferase